MPAGLTHLRDRLAASEGWPALAAALAKGEAGAIDGAWGSSATLAIAALAAQQSAPLLAVVPHLTDVEVWAEDLATFAGARPLVFPAYETWPVVERAGKLAPQTGDRLRVLQALLADPAPGRIVLAPIAAIVQPVPVRDRLASNGRKLKLGETLDPQELCTWLTAAGYRPADSVEFPGEFGRRGGIVDVYPPDATDPFRLEFFGEELESIRQFAAQTQRSLEKRTELVVLKVEADSTPGQSAGFILDYFPAGSVSALVEPADLREQGKHFFERVADPAGLFSVNGAFAQLLKRPSVTVTAMPKPSVEATAHLRVESIERFSGNVTRVKDELDAVAGTDEVYVACQTDAEAKRLTDVLAAGKLATGERLKLVTGHVRAGFRLIATTAKAGGRRPPGKAPQGDAVPPLSSGTVVLGSHELFHKELVVGGTKGVGPGKPGRKVESRALDSFLELNDGDYVVHIAHGIARFRGMKMLSKAEGGGRKGEEEQAVSSSALRPPPSAVEEFLILEFKDGVFLYVPATRIDLVQRYVGGLNAEPALSKLGGTSWGRKKGQIAEAVLDMAAEMIQVQAVRNAIPGEAFPPDTEWQAEFEGAFPYQETPDQLTAIAEIKADLMRPKPMDRLLCGDVGYGKTEVAVRAAFKAVDNGKQVAVLVPTTVLAEQHFRTFSQRLAEYPFTVACLSRYQSPKQQRETIKALKEGGIDIVVGTHRLVSDGMAFKDLGLVVIDEEQRFGVEHKEKLKRLRTTVHVLTMTATPIPRTLHGALVGVREISNLETPPPERYPVETRIVRWDDQLIRHAIHREFNRGGQVYFVHNRVHDIKDIAAAVQGIVPEAKLTIGHGQMGEGELEKAMVAFVRKDADILVATTIIESGLDIPNANTIFIDEADQYGLADLHQLRGRVGRTKLRAYAYMIVDPLKMVSPNAQKRLKAIEEFTELGSGFKISMRDLEIRGAGNILGTEQSGHIAAVGYELYCQLLENAVRQLKQQPPKQAVEVNVDLPWPAFLPRDYVPGQKLRIEVYRRLARIRDAQRLDDFRQELADRYGPPPEPVQWLLRTTEVRLLCSRWGVRGIHRDGKDLVFSYRNEKKAKALVAQAAGRLKVIDDKTVYLRLQPGEDDPAAMYELLKRSMGK